MVRVGNAPCSWGVIEGIDEGPAGERGYRRVLDEMRETGYTGAELGPWGFMPTDLVRLRDELQVRELALIGSWVSIFLHDRDRHEQSARWQRWEERSAWSSWATTPTATPCALATPGASPPTWAWIRSHPGHALSGAGPRRSPSPSLIESLKQRT